MRKFKTILETNTVDSFKEEKNRYDLTIAKLDSNIEKISKAQQQDIHSEEPLDILRYINESLERLISEIEK